MVVGYNVQSAVDADSGLIIHHEVTDEGDDRRQLYPMAQQTKAELDQETLTVLADGGYSNGEQLAACDAEGITDLGWSEPEVRRQGDCSDVTGAQLIEPRLHCIAQLIERQPVICVPVVAHGVRHAVIGKVDMDKPCMMAMVITHQPSSDLRCPRPECERIP